MDTTTIVIIIFIVVSLIISMAIAFWCICAINPRESWEDDAQTEYVDDWVKKKKHEIM